MSAILFGWLAMIAIAVAAASPAGLDRKEAGMLAGLAAAATVMAGSIWVYLAFVSFCGSSSVDAVTALAVGILTYLVSAGAALRSDEPISRVLGLPTASVAGFAFSAIALGLLTGGPHHCST
ncbi:MAG TPA: hypothetical protein VFQ71_09460 [Gaiellales bacterium]|nr:hypothetical protein [Gaiellales bacterium]